MEEESGQSLNDLSLARLMNVGQQQGFSYAVQTRAGITIPNVSALSASSLGLVSNNGANKILATWTDAEIPASSIAGYNVFCKGNLSVDKRPILIVTVPLSPATFITTPDGSNTITITVQPVLSNGAVADIALCPTATVVLTAPPAATAGSVSASAYNSTDIACTASSGTVVTFNTNYYSTPASVHSTSSNTSRFTVPTGSGGNYSVSAQILFEPANTLPFGHAYTNGTYRNIYILKNGNLSMETDFPSPALDTSQAPISIAGQMLLADGDYLELKGNHDAGGNILMINTSTTMTITRLT